MTGREKNKPYSRIVQAVVLSSLWYMSLFSQDIKHDSTSIHNRIRGIRASSREVVPLGGSRVVENNSFYPGEKLVFDLSYGFIKAGRATMEVVDTTTVSGNDVYYIRTTARSTPFFDTLYKVRDSVKTFVDVEGIFPWKFEKHLREGGYSSDRYIEYKQKEMIAVKNKKDTIAVTPFVQDILSSFYYVRTFDLEVGKRFEIITYDGGKLYPLDVIVHKKEEVKVPAGRFECFCIEPVLESEGLFKGKGRLRIWVTADSRKMPVLMKSKILVGSIDCKLRSYRLKK